MNSNLNFDIDTESLLLQPDPNFSCFNTEKKSKGCLLESNESLVIENTSVSSSDNLQYDICTPIKLTEKYKDKAEHRLDRFKITVEELVTRRRELKQNTEKLKLRVKKLLDMPLLSKRNIMNLNY